MHYPLSRAFTLSLVLATALLIIAVIPKLTRVASSAGIAPPPVDQICNTSSITINSSGVASPYPSTLNVALPPSTITSLTVTLNGFSHTFPDDVDVLLVAPGGQNAIIMSDVGGSSPATGVTLTLDDAAATSLPDAGPLVSGTFKPTNINALETFPAPAPTPSGGSALSVFNGISPNGTWSLYIVDDVGGDAGSISGGWCLDITTIAATGCTLTCPGNISQPTDPGQCGANVTYPAPTEVGTCGTVTCSPASGSFFPTGVTTVTCTSSAGGGSCSFTVTITGSCLSGCNPTAITINSGGAAAPYPSPLTISGHTGAIISNVTVTLNNFGHAFPDDVDILLVGPGGQNAILMSDVGGSSPTSGITLTLDDAAASNLPDAGPLASGTFKPTNSGLGDAFPAPAPAPSGGSALSVFNGTLPNGVWRLYVTDDSAGDAGSISGGWCLNITTVPATCTLTCPADVTQANTPGQCGALVSYATPTTSGTCGPVVCSPPSGSFFPIGTTAVNCTASGGGICSFNVTVTGTCPTGCNPSAITINPGGAASPYPSTLTISGAPGNVASLTVTLDNLSHAFPDDVDILLVGPGGQNAIIMSDVGGSTAASNVTLTLDDAAATNLPDLGPLVSGTFKPTNSGAGDTFPAPAPAPSGGSALSVFNGTDPNGVWRLFITDDSGGDGGSISGGWCLNITYNACSITCPANQTVSNTPGQCGAVVNYPAPTTSGSCGTVTCEPASGSFFPVGTTTVTCTATAGPSCSFNVSVNDTEAPTCNLPANITQNNTPGQCSAVVNYTATASDNCPGAAIVCTPASGSVFPVGTTMVNCTASDSSPESSDTNCSFTVTIIDNQPPTIVCPANVTVGAASGQTSAIVNYPAPTASDNCPGVIVVCSPASGSSFPLGATTVNCTATDASGNQAGCSFTVFVGGTILASADSFLRDGAANTNEGANNLLRIQSSGHNRVVVRFDLTGVSTVGLQSATLVLHITDNSDNWGPTGRPVDAHRLLADWTEGNGHTVGDQPNFRGTGEGVTWNCAKDSDISNQNDDCVSQWNGGTFAAATAAAVLHTNGQMGDVSWNVTADVLAGASNGWLIKKQGNEGLSGQVKYYSREGAVVAGYPNLAPRLVLVYAP